MTKVLVVDDDAPCGKGVANLLRKCGFDVEFTDDSRHAIVQHKRSPVDVILLDMLFEDLPDGLATARAIRKHDSCVGIMALTAYRREYEQRDRKKVVDDWLDKPIYTEDEAEALRLRLDTCAALARQRYVQTWFSGLQAYGADASPQSCETALLALARLVGQGCDSATRDQLLAITRFRLLAAFASLFRDSQDRYARFLDVISRSSANPRAMLETATTAELAKVIEKGAQDALRALELHKGFFSDKQE